MSQSLHGVLLDIDGTLVDSNQAHIKSWVSALSNYGYNVEEKAVRQKIGQGGDHLIPELIKISKDSKLCHQIDELRGDIFRETYLPKLKPFPYAQQLLEFLSALGLKLVAATSSPIDDVKRLLRQAGIEKYFDAVTSASDVENSKPNKDIIESALLKGALSPAAAFMVGDSPFDVEAAAQAHLPIVAFTCGGWKASDLDYAQAIFSDPEDFFRYLKKEEDPLMSLHTILYKYKIQNPFNKKGARNLPEVNPYRS